MIFDISFSDQGDSRQIMLAKSLPVLQCILCLFEKTGSSLYSYEDLVGHDEALMQATRDIDSSAHYQKACDEYERLLKTRHARIPTVATTLRKILLVELGERFPGVEKNGFDFGIILVPSSSSKLLLEGATVIYAIYPRKEPGQMAESDGWPLMRATPPCTIRVPVDAGQSCFWGMIAAGLSDLLRAKRIPLFANPTESTNAGRRKQALTGILETMPSMPMFVDDRVRHFFLNHALNALGEWGGKNFSRSAESVVSLGSETCIENRVDGSVTVTPSPFLQHS